MVRQMGGTVHLVRYTRFSFLLCLAGWWFDQPAEELHYGEDDEKRPKKYYRAWAYDQDQDDGSDQREDQRRGIALLFQQLGQRQPGGSQDQAHA